MANLDRCSACSSFVPALASACPGCDAPRKPRIGRVGRIALGLLGGSTLAVTLMACYGVPYDEGMCDDSSSDLDHDGFCGVYDCDESNASRNAGRYDSPGNGLDENCDGIDGMRSAEDSGRSDAGR